MATNSPNRIKLVDGDTGEELDSGRMVWVPPKIRIKEGWFMAMQSGLEQLAKGKPLRGESMRVLLYLMSQMDYENHMRPTVSEIAEALNMKKQNASRALMQLRERQIVIDGEHGALRLEASYGWRGKVRSLRDYEREQQREFDDRQREEARAEAEAVA
jgi:DNA-binding MarR family transcriptional regulator